MRIVLAVAALVAAGSLAGALVLALSSVRATGSRSRAAARMSSSRVPARPPASRPSASATTSPATAGYSFSTLDNARDRTFNRLLGINALGHICGYLGSGATGHPNRGFILRPPYGQAHYQAIDVPRSAQTQLTGLNDAGVQVGFWSAQATSPGGNFGFYLKSGRFVSVSFPARGSVRPPVNQLLGVNNHDVAVGFYTDGKGSRHGYTYDIATKKFTPVAVPGGSVTAAAINNAGQVAGFVTSPKGLTEGFVLLNGNLTRLSVPGATMTQALGINDAGEVVGDYQLGNGSGASVHGFTWTQQEGFKTVDDPGAASATTINGVNDAGELVGFYVDRAGTHGLLAMPSS